MSLRDRWYLTIVNKFQKHAFRNFFNINIAFMRLLVNLSIYSLDNVFTY